MENLRGLATGIGSLPHQDVDAALDLIFKYAPEIPFWPQLPKRDKREGMFAQFSEKLPCLEFTPEGLIFKPEKKEKDLETFYGRIISDDVDYFKISQDYSLGAYKFYQRLEKTDLSKIKFIKGHVTGPLTFAAGLKDGQDIALLHDPVFLQAISKGLAMKALWQIEFFKKFGKKLIIFIDEPYLAAFGSAFAAINREEVIKVLTEISAEIKANGALVGVHCCGNTDWSIFTDIDSIDIINFDAFGFLNKLVLYAQNLQGFLKRGGIICWGIVPTQEFTGQESADLLIGKIKEGINSLVKKGVGRDLLLERLLISPSCGLGTLEVKKSEEIFRLLAQISAKLQKNP